MEHGRPLHDGEQLRATRSELLDWCQEDEMPLLYASSGVGLRRAGPSSARSAPASGRSTSTATRSSCSTSSCAARCRSKTAQIAGFRYFNVYGPNEAHKGRMASVAFHAYQPARRRPARCKLFEGSGGYGNGEQRRDFVLRRRRGRREPLVPRAPRAYRASSTAAPAARRPSTSSPRRRSTRCRAREHTARELAQRRPDRVHPVSRGRSRQVPELHRGRPVAAARRGLSRRVHDASSRAWPRT